MSVLSYEELRVGLQETTKKLDARERRLRELGVTDWEPQPPAEEEKEPAVTYEELKTRLAELQGEIERERHIKMNGETVIALCHHRRENGTKCRAAAVRKQKYCSYHLKHRGRRLKMARARARSERWRVELPPLEDLYAVQVGIQRVLDAVAGGLLDRSQAWAMLYGLQQAAANLRLPHQDWEDSDHFGDGEECEWDTFAKEHGLAEDFDVDTPPDEAFPPPAISAEAVEQAADGKAATETVSPAPDTAEKKAPQAETDTPQKRVEEAK